MQSMPCKCLSRGDVLGEIHTSKCSQRSLRKWREMTSSPVPGDNRPASRESNEDGKVSTFLAF